MIVDPDQYRRAEAARRDAEIIYEQRLAKARAERAAEWPETRRELMKRWIASKRALEESGEPFVMPDPAPVEPPDYWLADVRVDPVPVKPPPHGEGDAGAVTAAGVDLLGRPTQRLLTAEEQFRAAAESPVSRGLKRVAGWQG